MARLMTRALGAIAVLVLLVSACSGGNGSPSASIAPDVALTTKTVTVALADGFPPNFPVPPGAELINSFNNRDGSSSVSAAWRLPGTAVEIVDYFVRLDDQRWRLANVWETLGSTYLVFEDATGEFATAEGSLTAEYERETQLAITLSGVLPGGDLQDLDLIHAILSDIPSEGAGLPSGMPESLIPPESDIVSATSVGELGVSAVWFNSDLLAGDLAEIYTAAAENWSGATIESIDGSELWTLKFGDGVLRVTVILVPGDGPTDVLILLEEM